MKNINNFQLKKMKREELKMIFGASEATAKCGSRDSVTCSGTSCSAQDDSHCQCNTGGVVTRTDCPIA